MKIGIDARLYGTAHRGIGRYTAEIIKNLEKLDQENEYFVFLQHDGYEAYQPQNPNFKKVSADFRVYGLQEQFLFPLMLAGHKLDLVYFTHFNVPLFYPGKFIVTIHDLIISHYPTSRATTLNPLLYQFKLLLYRLVVKSAAKRAKKIIAVSKYTRDDIIKLLKVKPEKIKVVYEGVDLPLTGQLDCQQVLKELQIADDFIMYTGAAYPHKNLERLVGAFSGVIVDLPKLTLVLVGRDNYFYGQLKKYIDELADPKLKERVIFTDYLSDEKLACLYQRAKAYVFPSLIEGFGLPPLEAQTYGTPVISSDRTCLPEVLGDSAVYFDPENIEEIAEKIKLIISDQALQEKLVTAGKENLKRYSWFEATKEIFGLIKNINN